MRVRSVALTTLLILLVGDCGESAKRPLQSPKIAIVNEHPFHQEILAGLVDATAQYRDTTTFFLHPDVFPREPRNYGLVPWLMDVVCKSHA